MPKFRVELLPSNWVRDSGKHGLTIDGAAAANLTTSKGGGRLEAVLSIRLKPQEPVTPLVERAFELARSGRFPDVTQIERALGDEGYPKSSPHWNSTTLRRQLRETCRKAVAERQQPLDADV